MPFNVFVKERAVSARLQRGETVKSVLGYGGCSCDRHSLAAAGYLSSAVGEWSPLSFARTGWKLLEMPLVC